MILNYDEGSLLICMYELRVRLQLKSDQSLVYHSNVCISAMWFGKAKSSFTSSSKARKKPFSFFCFNILTSHGNPTECQLAAVSWTRSGERLENVAKRNKTEQTKWDRENEWTGRRCVARRRTRKRRVEQTREEGKLFFIHSR